MKLKIFILSAAIALLSASAGNLRKVYALSQNEAVEWAYSQVDKWMRDKNGNWSGQCVALVLEYTTNNFDYALYMSPADFDSFDVSKMPEGWQKILYTPDFTPAPGDIVFWKPGSQNGLTIYSTGHSAIVVSVTEDGWVTLDQNWNAEDSKVGTPAALVTRNKFDLVMGVLRPPFNKKAEPQTPPVLPASGGKPSSWAEAQVNAAIAVNLAPRALRSNYAQPITRAEFCALAAALYENITGYEIAVRTAFVDTSDVNVQKMAALGIVSGTGGNLFAPHDYLTREQAAVTLSRLAAALGKPLPGSQAAFADNGEISAWALESVGQIQAAEIMSGIGYNKFAPKNQYTREQSIVTMMRLFDFVK